VSDLKNLGSRAPTGPTTPDELLDLFVGWATDHGYTLYPHQEEAILEVLFDKHVVLNTPTGSGKSMVALAMHFRAFATGRRSVYTSPIKALVSEKFFDLCKHFGAENVGMMTGDASINTKAPVLACTQEILAAMALSEGAGASIHAAVLDEFHYYADPDRGMAWQIPLLTLPKTRFLLMSATLGDMRPICDDLQKRSGVEVSLVQAVQRPVPLDYSYRDEEAIHETILDLIKRNKAPVYVVNFTQKACAELAQSLTSLDFAFPEEKKAIAEELKGVRFDSPYGKDVQRYLRHGIGLHHAGLLPRYRLLAERLAQAGRLKLIIGTDTLGVGINVPIRTVLFSRLCKYDGRKTSILSVRDFQQIAGRAGRKGYDDQGYVVCQAPEHVIENKKLTAKAAGDKAKLRKLVMKKPPEFGYAHWDEDTFKRLISSVSEPLQSRFTLSHGMLINLLQRTTLERRGGYGLLIDLIRICHENAGRKRRLRQEAKQLFKQLREARIIELRPRAGRKGHDVVVAPELQRDFSLYQSLSLFLVHAVGRLDPSTDDFPFKVLSLAEAIIEDPQAILKRQQEKARTEAFNQLKAEGVEFDQRQEILEKITWPMPDSDYIFQAFDDYAQTHPWVKAGDLRPKSVARDMFSRYCTFNQYVRDLGLERIEGALLRHLSQTYKVLVQTVPAPLKTDALIDLISYLRQVLQRADSSLVKIWEAMVQGVPLVDEETPLEPIKPLDITKDSRLFEARVRAEMHTFVQALTRFDYEEAEQTVRQDPEDPWPAKRIEEALEPFYADHDELVFDQNARRHALTRMELLEPRLWRVTQTLCDPEGDNFWFIEGRIDLRDQEVPDGPLVVVETIGR
jgi:superfamily II RNA helicase